MRVAQRWKGAESEPGAVEDIYRERGWEETHGVSVAGLMVRFGEGG